mmetsp:Transcript_56810/g.164549  ORF Transcript_56810/g.164549 Transcript_56810/m.164549 type:complete len:201 (-) Transcript_56810:1278-1880(-)
MCPTSRATHPAPPPAESLCSRSSCARGGSEAGPPKRTPSASPFWWKAQAASPTFGHSVSALMPRRSLPLLLWTPYPTVRSLMASRARWRPQLTPSEPPPPSSAAGRGYAFGKVRQGATHPRPRPRLGSSLERRGCRTSGSWRGCSRRPGPRSIRTLSKSTSSRTRTPRHTTTPLAAWAAPPGRPRRMLSTSGRSGCHARH